MLAVKARGSLWQGQELGMVCAQHLHSDVAAPSWSGPCHGRRVGRAFVPVGGRGQSRAAAKWALGAMRSQVLVKKPGVKVGAWALPLP